MVRTVILIMALTLAGCAATSRTFTRPANLYDPPEYPFYYDALWADFFWRCPTPEEDGVRVEGYAVSSTRSNMGILRFEVVLRARDAKGNIVVERWTYGDPLDADNITPIAFALAVPKAADAVGYDLFYWFQSRDGNGNGNGTSHRRSEPRVVRVQGFGVFGTIDLT